MPGFEFITDLHGDAGFIAYWNSFTSNVWVKALEVSGEGNAVDKAQCPFDEDGECQKRGCLNKEGQRGWRMHADDFLKMNVNTLNFLKEHPDVLTETHRTAFENECGLIEREEKTYNEYATYLLESYFIPSIKDVICKGAQKLSIWNRFSDPDLYPCPREFSFYRPAGQLTKEQGEVGPDTGSQWY